MADHRFQMYVQPLREMDPPIVSRERLAQFIHDVYHNFDELHVHHRKMLNTLHEIQREEHPCIRTITAAIYDAVLNFREAYMEYIPHYPIAAYRIDDEMANNPAFADFVEVSPIWCEIWGLADACGSDALVCPMRGSST